MNKNKSYENLFNNILLYVIFDLYASNMELLTNAKLYNLAMFFCAKKNYKQMKKYLIRLIFFSSNAKYINLSAYKLAKHYDIIEKNTKQLIRYYKIAINHFNSLAMNDYGFWLFNNKSYDEAVKYYDMAIKYNNVQTYNNIGFYHQFITKDYELMKYYYMKAIELHNIDSIINYAHYCKENNKINLMIELLEKGKKLGSRDAILNLGCHYQKTNDIKKMISTYIEAINMGCNISMNNLAMYYMSINDAMNGIKYFKMGSDNGNVVCTYNLAMHYMYVIKNPDTAIQYFIKAIKNKFNKQILDEISNYYHVKLSTLTFNDIDPYILNIYLQIKNIKLSNETINCPISFENTNHCFVTQCNHKFSHYILFVNQCPLCRNIFIESDFDNINFEQIVRI